MAEDFVRCILVLIFGFWSCDKSGGSKEGKVVDLAENERSWVEVESPDIENLTVLG